MACLVFLTMNNKQGEEFNDPFDDLAERLGDLSVSVSADDDYYYPSSYNSNQTGFLGAHKEVVKDEKDYFHKGPKSNDNSVSFGGYNKKQRVTFKKENSCENIGEDQDSFKEEDEEDEQQKDFFQEETVKIFTTNNKDVFLVEKSPKGKKEKFKNSFEEEIEYQKDCKDKLSEKPSKKEFYDGNSKIPFKNYQNSGNKLKKRKLNEI